MKPKSKPRWSGLSVKALGHAEYSRLWRLKSGRTKVSLPLAVRRERFPQRPNGEQRGPS